MYVDKHHIESHRNRNRKPKMALQSTLALVKPDAHERAAEVLLGAKRTGFEVAQVLETTMTKAQAEEFYSEHKERPFFQDLVEFMCSGPLTAAVLRRSDAIAAWRNTLGPTDPAEAVDSAPSSIRARFGTDKTRNAAHGSDSPASAEREIAFFFPNYSAPTPRTGADAKLYLNETICPLLTRALTEMCAVSPARPVEWLAHFLAGEAGHAPEVGNTSSNGVAHLNGVRAPAKKIYFILGGPGSGKGTQCKMLVEKFGFAHFSAGDLLRAEVASGSKRGEMIGEMIREGQIVPGEITIELLKNAVESSSASGILIDGFPRKLAQAGSFEKDVSDFEFVLFMDCPEEEMEKRLLKRGETSGRTDDNIESIRKRFKTFVETSMPVVEYFEAKGKVRRIDATKPMDEVFAQVEKLF